MLRKKSCPSQRSIEVAKGVDTAADLLQEGGKRGKGTSAVQGGVGWGGGGGVGKGGVTRPERDVVFWGKGLSFHLKGEKGRSPHVFFVIRLSASERKKRRSHSPRKKRKKRAIISSLVEKHSWVEGRGERERDGVLILNISASVKKRSTLEDRLKVR